MRETRVQSLRREDPPEKEMATHSSTLAWKNPKDGGAWWATVHRVAKSLTWLSDFTDWLTEVENIKGKLHHINSQTAEKQSKILKAVREERNLIS